MNKVSVLVFAGSLAAMVGWLAVHERSEPTRAAPSSSAQPSGEGGAPDLDATGDPAPPPPPPPDPSDPDPPPAEESVVSISLSGVPDRQRQTWSASITVRAVDGLLRPRESVVVAARWTSTSPSFTPTDTQCTTNLNGTCTMTIRNLQRSAVLDVTLTPLSVTGPGVTAAPLPGPITLAAP